MQMYETKFLIKKYVQQPKFNKFKYFSKYNKTKVLKKDAEIVVIGGGAAGMAAAYFASKEKAKVVMIEKMKETGKKILISGGTRCNILPMSIEPEYDYYTNSPKSALKSIFSTWDLEACKEWLEDPLSIDLKLITELESNKYFPENHSGKLVRNKLEFSCLKNGVDIQKNIEIKSIKKIDNKWHCYDKDEKLIIISNVVIMATGGKSCPKLGTEGKGYEILKNCGHSLIDVYPALTPLHGRHPGENQLPGISLYNVNAVTKNNKKKIIDKSIRNGFLFTHKGYSGPVILDLSHSFTKSDNYCQNKYKIHINWTNDLEKIWKERLLKGSNKELVINRIHKYGIPLRLAEALCHESDIIPSTDLKISQLKINSKNKLIKNLVDYEIDVTGHGGFNLAEVTGGGIPLTEINCQTMESTKMANLYIIGELLDVFGRIGGFNFYFAWLTGRAAGLDATKKSL